MSSIDDKHVLSIFTVSSTNEQQIFRRAFIQSASLLFVIVCGTCAVLVYHILQPFLTSILWSILAGALLFPLKTRCASLVQCYLEQLETNSCLLVSGLVVLLPLKIIDHIIESLGPLCMQKWKQLVLMIMFLPTMEFLQSGVVYRSLVTIGYEYYVRLERHVENFHSPWMIGMIGIYVIAVLTIYNRSDGWKWILKGLAVPIWYCLLLYTSQILPINYRLIVVLLIVILAVIGYVFERNGNESDSSRIKKHERSIFQRIRTYIPRPSPISSSSSSSTRYFTLIFWSLLSLKVYEFCWYLIPISIFIIIYKILKCLFFYTYTYLTSQTRVKYILERMIYFWTLRRDVLIPTPLSLIIRCLRKGDKKINHGLQQSIDYLVSAAIIVTVLMVVLFGTLFLLVQIQHESIHMIKLTSSFVNQTTILQHILPDQDYVGRFMQRALDKVYTFGRTWITTQIVKVQPPRREPVCCLPLSINPNDSPYMHIDTLGQGSLSNKNLEEQALELWENLYTYINNTSSSFFLPSRNRSRMFYSISNQTFGLSNLVTQLERNFDFHLSDLYRLLRDNLDILWTVFDSIWSNTTLVLTLFSTIISLIFTGGFALLNFFLSFIVFITLLFYLLSHSNQPVYRPTEWLNNTLAIGGAGLGKAVNDAVTSVFIASLKMAAFYGLYTYILHTLLGSNLVFLPTVIASICAVTLKSFWAALPGCLDLWLVQQRPVSALILLLAQIVPMYIVDTAIYSEVKGGGHQYLTALAIAGGVYYRGIEGALIGPIILCCLLVGIRMYNETMATPVLANPGQSQMRNMKQSFRRFSSLQQEVVH